MKKKSKQYCLYLLFNLQPNTIYFHISVFAQDGAQPTAQCASAEALGAAAADLAQPRTSEGQAHFGSARRLGGFGGLLERITTYLSFVPPKYVNFAKYLKMQKTIWNVH